MKSIVAVDKFRNAGVLALFLLMIAGVMPGAFADQGAAVTSTSATPLTDVVENAKQYGGNVLDTIEEYFNKSGLKEIRQKINDQYKLYIKPYFKAQYELTNNVFKAPDDDSDHTDNLWSFTPGLQYLYQSQYGVIGGAYEATFRYFTQFPGQNEVDQKFLVYANIQPKENMYVRVSERIDQAGATAGASNFEPVNYFDNTVNVVVGLISGDLTHEFGYENFDRDFQTVAAERYGHNDHKYDYRIYYKIAEEVSVYSGVKLGFLNYDKIAYRDTTFIEVPIGIQGKLLLGWIGNAMVGFHHRNLEDSNYNDITHIVTNIAVQKIFNENQTTLEMGFLRQPVESTFSTATIYDEKMWHSSVKHLINPKLRGRASIYYANRDFEEATLTGTRVIVGGIVFVPVTGVVKRVDDVFGIGLGVDYNVREWMILHADYRLERRDSNISSLDYTENAMILKTSIPL